MFTSNLHKSCARSLLGKALSLNRANNDSLRQYNQWQLKAHSIIASFCEISGNTEQEQSSYGQWITFPDLASLLDPFINCGERGTLTVDPRDVITRGLCIGGAAGSSVLWTDSIDLIGIGFGWMTLLSSGACHLLTIFLSSRLGPTISWLGVFCLRSSWCAADSGMTCETSTSEVLGLVIIGAGFSTLL